MSTNTAVSGYVVHRGITPNGTYSDDYPDTFPVPFTQTTYADLNVTDGTIYYYIVSIVDSTGTDLNYSAVASAMPFSLTKFVTPPVVVGTIRDLNHGAFTGLVGVQIQVGASPVTVRMLGRLVAPGNGKPHPMTILDTSSNVLGTATIPAGGTEGTFVYAALDAGSATLAAGTTYFVVSAEDNTNGGDAFFDVDSTRQHDRSVAAITAAVTKVTGATTFSQGAGANHDPGPLDFQY